MGPLNKRMRFLSWTGSVLLIACRNDLSAFEASVLVSLVPNRGQHGEHTGADRDVAQQNGRVVSDSVS